MASADTGKTNCWEFTGCGRESECPAYPKAGRVCYLLSNTDGKAHGSYLLKLQTCRECGFYKAVAVEKTI